MHHISKAAAVITFPARTAFAVASAGVRTTARLVGWAAEQATGQSGVGSAPPVSVPVPPPSEPEVDAMEPTREAPAKKASAKKAPTKKVPAKKVPASQVPLKSAPTPSLPAGLEAIDDGLEVDEPAPKKTAAKKTAAKKTAAKKTAKKAPAKKPAARKAPSEQAAVLAPALGLSEDEVAEVAGTDTASGADGR